MSVIQNNLLMTPEGYQISRSVRLRRSASAYFNRTFGTPTNANIWSLSGWAKRGLLGTQISLFGASVTSYTSVTFLSGDTLRINLGNGTNGQLVTTQVFRDPSAYYHIAIAYDSTQATASNRIKLYINGVQVTSFSTANYPAQNVSAEWNYAGAVGTIGTASTEYWDGYLTEVNFIDGQALTPSSFGETNPVTGVWQPKKYAGTYGTNGFYLNFSDPSAATAAAIGKDYSGNGNNWTPNNISVTAGVTYDSMLDVPTPWADGGNGRGNYPVLNPLAVGGIYAGTLSNGNLTAASGSVTQRPSTIGISSGSWYAEMTLAGTANGNNFGIELSAGISNGGWSWVYDGSTYVNGSRTGVVLSSWSTNATLMIAVDVTNGKLYFGQNGTWLGSANPSAGTGANISFTAGSEVVISCGAGTATFHANFGQRPFAYTPPTGFKALNTQNLPDATIKKGNQYFDVNTWNGTGATQSITNGGFQPDLVWVKSRSNVAYHNIVDAVRGLGNTLYSNATDAETFIANQVTTLNSNGFTLGADANGGTNYSGRTYVGWQWKESVSAGFDIVTYTGTGANTTVAHSLGVKPSLIIIKPRSAVNPWSVYHASIGATKYMLLNTTDAAATNATFMNNTEPTSSVFSLGSGTYVNQSTVTHVAYLFAEVAGFSKLGSYTGNGSADGPFVYCGFRPKFLLVKRSDSLSDWYMVDTSRDTYNLATKSLFADLSDAEGTIYATFDTLSNGFKLRGSTANNMNASGGTYIFAAFAENPFKNSLAR